MKNYKVIFIGESSVGKTSIINRLCLDQFDENSESTIGAAYRRHHININENIIILDIWDTAGQERFNSLIPMYLRDATAVFIVYDVNNELTFKKIKNRWIPLINNYYHKLPLIYCCANKIDLIGKNIDKNDIVHHQLIEIENLLPNSCRIFKTSAKYDIGINEVFNQLATEIHKNNNNKIISIEDSEENIGYDYYNYDYDYNDNNCCY